MNERRDPVAIDDRVTVGDGEDVAATLGDRAARRHSKTGRTAIPDSRVLVADQRLHLPAIVGGIDQHEDRATGNRDAAASRDKAEAGLQVSGCAQPPSRVVRTDEAGGGDCSMRRRVQHPQRTTTLNRAFGQRQCAGPGMLLKELANQGWPVETAIRHPAGAPAEWTSVQPEEDKRGWGVRQG